ncbi:uncharacterized protein Gasu_05090 [Galdieria sulphuraria]|uniref:Uncharacterized protein n=1 Tax=Galdieria sulphuraria TaxID=130081 RepID=M2Y997_GALSU|nr:uncharacterized protein Gasu_05090 [Galdieria sulphuraria]EME32424.1 hypothetical protein Gasu_05090 [Galdieria sulphuraria]|eukprot:XP_005708944.1 hypothetical protein Gasu_05090 [Galdieria sulphuraria]
MRSNLIDNIAALVANDSKVSSRPNWIAAKFLRELANELQGIEEKKWFKLSILKDFLRMFGKLRLKA